MSELLVVGTVGRPHGLRGQVSVRPRTDSIEQRFAPGTRMTAGSMSLTVAGFSHHGGRLVVEFAQVRDRVAAEQLRGQDLVIQADPTDLEPEEFLDTQLIGLVATDPENNALGEVVDVRHYPAQDLLVVKTSNGERLVPFVVELVPEVDPASGRLVINPIPGLLSEVADAD